MKIALLMSLFSLTALAADPHASLKSNSGVPSKTGERCFKVVAHRGASSKFPEHTKAAYEAAIDMGADYIEPDLVMTKDNVLIARHESMLSYSTDVEQKFPTRKATKTVDGQKVTDWFSEDFTLAEIKTLKARQTRGFRNQSHNGKEDILTFAEVIEIAQKKGKEVGRVVGVFPETKSAAYFRSIKKPMEDILLADLKKYGWDKKDSPVIIQSFELSSLKRIKEKSALPLVFLVGDLKFKPADAEFSKDKRTYADFVKPREMKKLKKEGIYAMGFWKGLIVPTTPSGELFEPTALIADAKQEGLKVFVYSFASDKEILPQGYNNDPVREYVNFCRLRVDGVFTDSPDDAVKASFFR